MNENKNFGDDLSPLCPRLCGSYQGGGSVQPTGRRSLCPIADPPTMSSGTLEPYLSFMAGMAVPRSADATFTDGTPADDSQGCRLSDETLIRGQRGDLVSNQKQVGGIRSRHGNHRHVWYADVACCQDNFNNDPRGVQ